jgi:hypothetical protein
VKGKSAENGSTKAPQRIEEREDSDIDAAIAGDPDWTEFEPIDWRAPALSAGAFTPALSL